MFCQRLKRPLTITIILSLFMLTAPLLAAGELQLSQPIPGEESFIYLKSRQIDTRAASSAMLTGESRAAGQHGLIQLAAAPDDEQRAQLTASGVQLLGYIPQNSWLASLPPDLTAVRKLDFVRWIGPLLPQDRVEPAIQDGNFDSWAMTEEGNVRLEITVFPDVSLEEAAAAVGRHGGRVSAQNETFHRLQVELPPAALWSLAAEDGLQWIAQAGAPMQILADGSRAIIGADAVQDNPYNLDGTGVQVGIWDAALADAAHADFGGRLVTAETFPAEEKYINHATHVAGILGGAGTLSEANGGQPGQWRGVAPGADLISFHWQMATADHDVAINDYGIDISQNSWAIGGCNGAGLYDYWSRDYDAIVTGVYGRGVPVVFAAGNQRQQCDTPYGTIHRGPQSAKNVITVGGIRSSDGDMMASSSWGPVSDGRLKPELVAAGQTTASSGIYATISNDTYGYFTGTSMAAPAVSGTIALLLQQHHNLCSAEHTLLPSSSKALLIHGATDLVDEATPLHPGPDYASGYGRVNGQESVELLDNYIESVVHDGASNLYPLTIAAGESSLKVTLVWDDAPAEPNAVLTLVNDLDLELVAPDGSTVYGPWILDPANPDQPAQRHSWKVGESGTRDRHNVVEQVVVDNPQAGTWLIRVSGASVPQGPQSYSLVSDSLSTGSCGAEIAPTAISLQGTNSEVVQAAVRSAYLLLAGVVALALFSLAAARRPVLARR